jgi:hypothetical protein
VSVGDQTAELRPAIVNVTTPPRCFRPRGERLRRSSSRSQLQGSGVEAYSCDRMLTRYRMFTPLVAALCLFSASLWSPSLGMGGAHDHAVSYVWAHGHQHKVLHHHDHGDQHHHDHHAEKQAGTRIVPQATVAGADHGDDDHVIHTASLGTPILAATNAIGVSASTPARVYSFNRPAQVTVSPHAGPLRGPPLLASLRTTILLV